MEWIRSGKMLINFLVSGLVSAPLHWYHVGQRFSKCEARLPGGAPERFSMRKKELGLCGDQVPPPRQKGCKSAHSLHLHLPVWVRVSRIDFDQKQVPVGCSQRTICVYSCLHCILARVLHGSEFQDPLPPRTRDVQYLTRPATRTYCQLVLQTDPTRRHKIRKPTRTRISYEHWKHAIINTRSCVFGSKSVGC